MGAEVPCPELSRTRRPRSPPRRSWPGSAGDGAASGTIRVMDLTGSLLVASPLLADPNFFRTVVLVLQHHDDGAVGVVLNRPSGSPVDAHLPAWAPLAADPRVVFVGGPVEEAVAIALGDAGEEMPVAGLRIVDLESVQAGTWVRVFSGYAGWSPGQVEAELEEGSWMVVEARMEDARTPDPGALWHDVLRRQRGPLRLLATYPPDPALN